MGEPLYSTPSRYGKCIMQHTSLRYIEDCLHSPGRFRRTDCTRLTAIRLQRLRRMFIITDQTVSTWQHCSALVLPLWWHISSGPGSRRLDCTSAVSSQSLSVLYTGRLLKAWKQVSTGRQATAPSCYGEAEDEAIL